MGTTFDDLTSHTGSAKNTTPDGSTPESDGAVRDARAVSVSTEIPCLTDFWLPEDNENYAPAFNRAADFSRANQIGILVDTSCGVYQPVNISGAKFRCASGVIIRATGLNGSVLFRDNGTAEAELPIAAGVTSGDTAISTLTPHELIPGDWVLLTSQRSCAHADAGKDWQLGTVTDPESDYPYFAEPLQVMTVESTTTFTVTPIIFPDYRTDNTQETYSGPRTHSTIRKINFTTGTQFIGGRIVAPARASRMFDFLWSYMPIVDCEFDLADAPGQAVYSKYTYGAKCKAVIGRPFNWTMVLSHAQYNSVRDVSSWYGDYDIEERYGSQGYDQTYDDICAIHPRVRVKAYEPVESGCTTHGNTYGITIDAMVIGHKRQAVSNRARFANIRVTSIGEAGNNNADAISLGEWGQQNLRLVLDVKNCHFAVQFSLSQASIDDSPETVTGDITGTVANAVSVIQLGSRLTNGVKPGSYCIHDLQVNNCQYVVLGSSYWHGFHFERIAINGDPFGTERGTMFSFGDNSAFNSVRKVTADSISANSLVRTQGLTDAALNNAAFGLAVDVDWSTINLTNSATPPLDGSKAIMTATRVPDVVARSAFNRLIVLNLVNTSLARTLVLNTDSTFPVGAYMDLLNRGALSLLVSPGTGVILLGSTGPFGTNTRTRVTRIDETTYWIASL
ncbi:hypothetical protein [Bordetella sp. BOR01]|uniref:hypothetical protein n=1 Tax=Bordetella sp. BOR01 TaxID=2854779 RepID=UPI001C447C01|nr:hypothetical protein [Bordetella sp. BOR01]MBV7482540.1 hypothetical protein [Bordetella sp. BOR01]